MFYKCKHNLLLKEYKVQHHYTSNYVNLAEVNRVTFEAHTDEQTGVVLHISSSASEHPLLVSAKHVFVFSHAQLSQLADAIRGLVADYESDKALAAFDAARDLEGGE